MIDKIRGVMKIVKLMTCDSAAGLIAGMGYLGFAVLFSLIMGAVMFVI